MRESDRGCGAHPLEGCRRSPPDGWKDHARGWPGGGPVDFWRPDRQICEGRLPSSFVAREGPTSDGIIQKQSGVRLAFAAPHLPAVMQCIYNGGAVFDWGANNLRKIRAH